MCCVLFQGISFLRLRLFPMRLLWDGVLYFSVSYEHWHSADLSLEISNLCHLHQSSIVRSVLCSVVRIAEGEGPCIMIIMSSAKTTILTFGALESGAIRSFIIMFHKFGSKTDPCGQPLVTRLELT
jgi:hypothetical protein